jgi:hypothetical protein
MGYDVNLGDPVGKDGLGVTSGQVVAIPEPATALLFGIGAMGAWMVRRNNLKVKEEMEG